MRVAMKVTDSKYGHSDSTTIREIGNPGEVIKAEDYLSHNFAGVLNRRLSEDPAWSGKAIKKVVINVILEN